MKKLILTATFAALTLSAVAPVQAMTLSNGLSVGLLTQTEIERRRPRIPGGSGCDTRQDIREHPECTPA